MGHSLTITIPAQVAEMRGLEAGDLMKWERLGGGDVTAQEEVGAFSSASCHTTWHKR